MNCDWNCHQRHHDHWMINSNLPAEYLLRKGEKPWYQKQPAVQDQVERSIGGNEHQNQSDGDDDDMMLMNMVTQIRIISLLMRESNWFTIGPIHVEYKQSVGGGGLVASSGKPEQWKNGRKPIAVITTLGSIIPSQLACSRDRWWSSSRLIAAVCEVQANLSIWPSLFR